MDAHLAQLVRMGKITRALAEQRASVPEELERLLGGAPARDSAGPSARPAPHRPSAIGLGGGRWRPSPSAPSTSPGSPPAASSRHLQGAGHRAAAPARADRPRRLREARGVQARVDLPALQERQHARRSSVFSRQFATLIASGMPMLRSLYTLEEQTEDEMLKKAIVALRQDVEAGSSRRAGDGAPARRVRPALPLDGQRRRGRRPPGGGARPGRRPAREARRAAPPGEVGDDVSGGGLRRRAARDDRRSSPSSSRSSSASSRSLAERPGATPSCR